MKKAGQAALNGTPDGIKAFLSTGQYDRQAQDEQGRGRARSSTRAARAAAAGRIALDGSADDIHEFLEVGQYVGRTPVDQEHASVAQLAAQAKAAGSKAAAQTRRPRTGAPPRMP